MGIFGGRAITRLRQLATSEKRQFDACVAAGDLHGALRHSERQEKAITELIGREPRELFHRFVLAGALYNRATVLDAVGRGEEAVATARRAVETYDMFDPVRGAAGGVEQQLRAMRSEDAAEVMIAHAADARARLARLLAKYHGKAQAAAVHRHGKAAVETYQELLRYGRETTQADVDRVTAQYKAAQEHLR